MIPLPCVLGAAENLEVLGVCLLLLCCVLSLAANSFLLSLSTLALLSLVFDVHRAAFVFHRLGLYGGAGLRARRGEEVADPGWKGQQKRRGKGDKVLIGLL